MSALGQKQTCAAHKLMSANVGRRIIRHAAVENLEANQTQSDWHIGFQNFCGASVVAHQKIRSCRFLTWINATLTCGVIILWGGVHLGGRNVESDKC